MKVTPKQALPMLLSYLKAGLVPFMVGSPGASKSSLVHQLAKENKLKVIDLRLSQCDPCDLLGFPNIQNNKSTYIPFDTFPLENDPIPEGYKGWLLFFDEFNGAPPAVQIAAYKPVLDHMVGQEKLHKNVAIVCAGNLDTDNAVVESMSTAMQSRLVHLELVVDHICWIEWALDNNINQMIIDFIKFKPAGLYTFKADHSDNTYGCPRTWEFLSKLLKVESIDSENILPLAAGVISEGLAREFITFTKNYNKEPRIETIISRPLEAIVPSEPSHLFAITGCISHNTNKTNVGNLMQYVNRLPIEFQVITIKEMVRKNKSILEHSSVINWRTINANKFF